VSLAARKRGENVHGSTAQVNDGAHYSNPVGQGDGFTGKGVGLKSSRRVVGGITSSGTWVNHCWLENCGLAARNNGKTLLSGPEKAGVGGNCPEYPETIVLLLRKGPFRTATKGAKKGMGVRQRARSHGEERGNPRAIF